MPVTKEKGLGAKPALLTRAKRRATEDLGQIQEDWDLKRRRRAASSLLDVCQWASKCHSWMESTCDRAEAAGSGTQSRWTSRGPRQRESISQLEVGGYPRCKGPRQRTTLDFGPGFNLQRTENLLFQKLLCETIGAGSDSSLLVSENRAEWTHSIIITMKDVICGCLKGGWALQFSPEHKS